MNDRPKSWWRTLLGYRAILVVDEIKFNDDPYALVSGRITKHHYEWMWRPFRKGREWASGPWTKVK
jgi:hypothetical protein